LQEENNKNFEVVQIFIDFFNFLKKLLEKTFFCYY